jgi:hypothetical protein
VFSGPWYFAGEESGWSNTQTLTIHAAGSAPTPSAIPKSSSTTSTMTLQPTATNYQSGAETGVLLGLGWVEIAITAFSVVVVLVFVVVFLRKRALK